MSFINFDFLWNLAWIIPLFLIVIWGGSKKRRSILCRIFQSEKSAEKWSSLSHTKRLVRNVFLCGALFFLIVAGARISWGKRVIPDSAAGRDIMVVFDVSKSMLSDDIKPSRLEHAKWLVRQIVKDNPGDRFGLIAFAGTSFLECPLTVDQTSFIQLVDSLQVDTIPLGGTNIQHALESAVRAFDGAEGSHKAVLLISDGDELTGRSASVVDQLAKNGIPVFAAGIGDPSNPALIRIPDANGEMKLLTDSEGNTVKSPLNESQLAELTSKTGGIYVRSTSADPGLTELENRIRLLERKKAGGLESMFRPIERPVYPIGIAFVLFCIALLISDVKNVHKKNTVWLIGLFILFARVPVTADAAEGKTDLPKTASEKPVVKASYQIYNEALQAQKEKNTDKASSLYEKAISTSGHDSDVRSSSFQNLGVISHSAARALMEKAQGSVNAQKLDDAEKSLEEASKKLDAAEDSYRESMRSVRMTIDSAKNQNLLLSDKKSIEEMKKKIEELKKLQQQAQQQTQQAKDQQQKENQQKSKKQDQQKSNVQQQTRQAKDTAEKLEKKASEMKQDNLQKSAEQAKKELEKAQKAQQQNKGKEAEKHLQKALDSLGGNKKDQQKQNDKKGSDKDQKKQDQKEQQQTQSDRNKQNTSGEPQPLADQQQNKTETGKMDKQQAEALLNEMNKDEKDLRDALKKRQMQIQPQTGVEKDW